MDMSLSKLQKFVMDREAWRAAIQGVAKNRTGLSDWSELNWTEGLIASNSILFADLLFLTILPLLFQLSIQTVDLSIFESFFLVSLVYGTI